MKQRHDMNASITKCLWRIVSDNTLTSPRWVLEIKLSKRDRRKIEWKRNNGAEPTSYESKR